MSHPRSEPKLTVLVFGAALRESSLNRQLAHLAAGVAEQSGAVVDFASMRDFNVPSYDGDAERAEGFPKGAEEFRRRLSDSDAFIVSSPEYNAAMTGTLKTSARGSTPTCSRSLTWSSGKEVGRARPRKVACYVARCYIIPFA